MVAKRVVRRIKHVPYFNVHTANWIRLLRKNLPWISPLCRLACIFIAIKCVLLLASTNRNGDWNLMAFNVRNAEENRVAEALTNIAAWEASEELPFRYELGIRAHLKFSKLDTKPGITFAFLAPDRTTGEIDAYTPQYITQSVTRLIDAIYRDVSRYGSRFSFVSITVCPLVDKLVGSPVSSFQEEIQRMSAILGSSMIKHREYAMQDHPMQCKAVYDFANCMLASLSQNADLAQDSSYVVALEDDFLINSPSLEQLWSVLAFLSPGQANSSLDDIVQLHSLPSMITFRLSEFSSLMELCAIAMFLTILIFTAWFRLWCRPFLLLHNGIFFTATFFLCILFVLMVGRGSWLMLIYRLTHTQFIFPAFNPEAASTGAAALYPSLVARELAAYLRMKPCELLHPHQTKASLIKEFLDLHDQPIHVAFPSLFKHIGLYSSYHRKMLNPYTIE